MSFMVFYYLGCKIDNQSCTSLIRSARILLTSGTTKRSQYRSKPSSRTRPSLLPTRVVVRRVLSDLAVQFTDKRRSIRPTDSFSPSSATISGSASSSTIRGLSQSGYNSARVRCLALTSFYSSISYSRRESVSTTTFYLPRRYIIVKKNYKSILAQRAYRLISYFIVMKYSRALWSMQIFTFEPIPQSSARHQDRERIIASISLLQISQLYSAGAIIFEKKATGYHSPSEYNYESTPVITPSKASVSSIVSRSRSQYRRIGVESS